MTDLDQAIETISEGGQALGVSCEDVYRAILNSPITAIEILKSIHEDDEKLRVEFMNVFESYASYLVQEAIRTKQEQEAGL